MSFYLFMQQDFLNSWSRCLALETSMIGYCVLGEKWTHFANKMFELVKIEVETGNQARRSKNLASTLTTV